MSHPPLTLSRLDAGIRLVLAAATVVFDGWALRTWPADWALLLFLHGFVTTFYLLATALFRIDPLYVAYGYSTLRGSRAQRRAAAVARHRPFG